MFELIWGDFEVEGKDNWKPLEPRKNMAISRDYGIFYKVGCKEDKIYGPVTQDEPVK